MLVRLCLSLLVVSACTHPGEPDDLGLAVTPPAEVDPNSPEPYASSFVWSGEAEIVYFASAAASSSPGRIKAVRVADLSVRIVDDESTQRRYLTISPDGEYLYYLEREQLLRRATDAIGAAETIALDVAAFRLSPDGSELAYDNTRTDAMMVYDVASATSRSVGEGHPVAFSPDGLHLFCSSERAERGSIVDPFILDLESDAREDVRPLQGLPKAIYWGADGILVLYQGTPVSELRIQNLTTGEDARLWMLADDETIVNTNFSWSSDGRRVFVWSDRCLRSDGIFDCSLSENTLRAIDVSDGRAAVIARGTQPAPGSAALQSPSGDRVAFILGGRIYVK